MKASEIKALPNSFFFRFRVHAINDVHYAAKTKRGYIVTCIRTMSKKEYGREEFYKYLFDDDIVIMSDIGVAKYKKEYYEKQKEELSKYGIDYDKIIKDTFESIIKTEKQ